MPTAVELLAQAGIDELTLVEQCRIPPNLFRPVTVRVRQIPVEAAMTEAIIDTSGRRVVSLLPRLATTQAEAGDSGIRPDVSVTK